jgi:hypothetical protein
VRSVTSLSPNQSPGRGDAGIKRTAAGTGTAESADVEIMELPLENVLVKYFEHFARSTFGNFFEEGAVVGD